MAINILKPKVSKIAHGVEGKSFLIYGGNSLGKTYQATRLDKPYVMATENGLSMIDGVPYDTYHEWADFKSAIEQFGNTRLATQIKKQYQTIIIDEIYGMSLMCQKYIMKKFGKKTTRVGEEEFEVYAESLADGDSKHNLYNLYEKEFFTEVNKIFKLTEKGFTVVFIAHEDFKEIMGLDREKHTKAFPKGDKRCVNPILNECEFVIYLKSQGLDEDGNRKKSAAYLAETDDFFARTKSDCFATKIEEFTAENLVKTIKDGMENISASGVKTINPEDRQFKEETTVKDVVKEFKKVISSIPGSKDVKGETEEGKIFKEKYKPILNKVLIQELGEDFQMKNAQEEDKESLAVALINFKTAIEKIK